MRKLIITESEKENILNLHRVHGYNNVINEQITPEILKKKYLDSGAISQEDFDKAMSQSDKINYQAWLVKKVAEGMIQPKDIGQFNHIFKTFEENKRLFPLKDINQIKTGAEYDEFMTIISKLKSDDKGENPENPEEAQSSQNLVSKSDVFKLEKVGIKLLGMADGYQIFEIPSELSGNEQAYKLYTEILGNCANRDKGEKVKLCTIAGKDRFDEYLNKGPLFLVFNLSDQLSPYQFSYETNEFKDKNNKSLF